MRLTRLTVLVTILSLLVAGIAFAGKDLDAVQKKGFVQAGVNGGVFGFGIKLGMQEEIHLFRCHPQHSLFFANQVGVRDLILDQAHHFPIG